MKTIKIALHYQMLLALVMGILCGWAFCGYYSAWGNIVNGIGQIFLHALSMIVVPLVFLSTVLSISKIDGVSSMGWIATKTFAYFLITAVIAAVIGIALTDVLRPGCGTYCPAIEDSTINKIMTNANEMASTTWMDKLVSIVPKNVFEAFAADNMLPIIFFSLMLGYFITKIQTGRRNGVNEMFESFQDVIMRITNFIIGLTPWGTFAIVMALVGKQAETISGFFLNIGIFVFAVWIALILMGGVVLPLIVTLIGRLSPIEHLRQIYTTLMLAFSTRSSYSAMPLMMSDAKEKMGVSDTITNFTIPLGITFNKIGTIIYECMAVLFVAQACEMELTIGQQALLIVVSIVTVLGAPSIPMAGVTFLAVLLKVMEFSDDRIMTYIGVLYAIDILCDMPKTMLNVYSVCCGTVIVARSEGEELRMS